MYEVTPNSPAFVQQVDDITLSADDVYRFANFLKQAVNNYCEEKYNDGPRTHLGASLIGDSCSRKLWYIFRWVQNISHEGRLLRLFQRGHREEDIFIELLRGVGFQVWDTNPDDEGNQFRILANQGHFGGSLDGLSAFPLMFIEFMPILAALGRVLLEFKTHNKSQFNNLVKNGVQISHPKHYDQMCSYGPAYGCRYALYCGVNKDTDELHFQLIRLNWQLGVTLVAKAERIIYATDPPARISQSPAYFECKFCDYPQICHYGKGEVSKNCRSCKNASPANEGQWQCSLYGQTIPKEFIAKGCEQWLNLLT